MAETNPEDEIVPRPTRGEPVGPAEPVEMPQVLGATFAERAAATKQVDDGAENKGVSADSTSRKRSSRKKS